MLETDWIRSRVFCMAALLLCGTACRSIPVPSRGGLTTATNFRLAQLEREITRLSGFAGGTVGVAVVHLENGQRVLLNADQRFPMASVYKLPIALSVLRRVQEGTESLDRQIHVMPQQLRPGSGVLILQVGRKGLTLTVQELLETMLTYSDNSATDLLLSLCGGPAKVKADLEALQLADISVDRPTLHMLADAAGVMQLPEPATWTLPRLQRALLSAPREVREAAQLAVDTDPRDSATPLALLQLLSRLWSGQLLPPEQTTTLLNILRANHTSGRRLKGALPPLTEVASKTGTIARSANDAGIVTLPENAGHVVVVVLVKGSEQPIEAREKAIADIARAVHDYFLFQMEAGGKAT